MLFLVHLVERVANLKQTFSTSNTSKGVVCVLRKTQMFENRA